MDTYFAPAARAEKGLLRSQVKSVSSSPVMNAVLQTTAGLLVVINENRQIVAYNNSFLEKLGISEPEKVLGLRVGETLHCKYAHDEPNGCGTTKYCASCGAVIAMMAAIDDNIQCEKTCALKVETNGHTEEVCLSVRAHPIMVDQKKWILVYAQDISQQQFWASIEDLFFHDINNMLCSMKSVSQYVSEHMPENELLYKLKLIADRVCKEVSMQGMLSHYKDKQGIVNLSSTKLSIIKEQVFNTVLNKSLSDNKNLIEEGLTEDICINTDPMLVSRVLINMLLNALEATEEGGSVKFRTIVEKTLMKWEVWNSSFIPENTQLRIFQKFFSTKSGNGHGLGTYSMKFFGEECLGGKISFTSTPEDGTTFIFSLPGKAVELEQR
jgi:K+-sensing histidine kinase KdpD